MHAYVCMSGKCRWNDDETTKVGNRNKQQKEPIGHLTLVIKTRVRVGETPRPISSVKSVVAFFLLYQLLNIYSDNLSARLLATT